MSAPAQQPAQAAEPATPEIPKSLPDEQLNKVVPIPTSDAVKKAAELFRQSYGAQHTNPTLHCMMEAQNWFDNRGPYRADLIKNVLALKLQGANREQIKTMLAAALMEDLNYFGIKVTMEGHLQRAESLLQNLRIGETSFTFEQVTPDSVRQSYEALSQRHPGQVRPCPEPTQSR